MVQIFFLMAGEGGLLKSLKRASLVSSAIFPCRKSASGRSWPACTFLSSVASLWREFLYSSIMLMFRLMPSTSLTIEYSPIAAPSCSLLPATLATEDAFTSNTSCTSHCFRLITISIGPSYSLGTMPSTSDSKNDSSGNHILVLRQILAFSKHNGTLYGTIVHNKQNFLITKKTGFLR